jgi:hypothetical protein
MTTTYIDGSVVYLVRCDFCDRMCDATKMAHSPSEVDGRDRFACPRCLGKYERQTGRGYRSASHHARGLAGLGSVRMNEPHGMLRCRTHGLVRWEGHVVCSSCDRVYTTHDAGLATDAPMQCACGAQLAPEGQEKFTARCICRKCFEARQS